MDVIFGTACLVSAGGALYFAQRAARAGADLRRREAAQQADGLAALAEYQRLEAENAALCREYDALMECCEAGVLILDSNGVIARANRTARLLLGVPAHSLVGKSLLQATLSNELNNLYKTARADWAIQQREIRMAGSGGSSLIVSISPIHGDGLAQRFILVAHDVTELRRLETVRQDFVANVSHELRTPLASIRAMAETLQDGALKDPTVADHFLGTIVTEAQRLTRISEDLLILSQVESRGVPEKTTFDLAELIREVARRFQPQAEKADITLRVDIPPTLETHASHDQIEQVLVNLIDNAIKYTPAGGCVHVTAEPRGEGLAVHVADTGIGIMKQDLPRIFERFYRVDRARSRQSGGTGLGLSIVKHIVEAHGGQVTVESEYNRGSTFTFTL
jgi:two-component system phosphate regulon sensor histidine kinase PhoR